MILDVFFIHFAVTNIIIVYKYELRILNFKSDSVLMSDFVVKSY